MAEIVQIPVIKIRVGEHALRMVAEDEDIDELAASIRRIGVIVPLLVRPVDDLFMLVAGHRRLAASRKVGLQNVPCVVHKAAKDVAAEISIAENLFRTDLTPVEMAAALKDVLEQKVMSIDELAAAVHRSKHWVTSMIDMLSWPGDVLEVIHNGKISVSAASNLALIQDESYRVFLLRNAVEQGATARTTAAWLQAWRAMQPPEKAVEAEPVAGPQRVQPALPQAPCIVCNQVFRTDGLAMVMICTGCINAIRGVGTPGT